MTGGTDPLPGESKLTLTVAETKQLWWFLDGAIMNVGTRHQLWASWGLCPRHSWAHAVMEIENRGGRPFSTSILLEDLLGRAVQDLRRTGLLPWRVTRARLRGRGECFTCAYGLLERSNVDPMGLDRERRRANEMARTRELLAASAGVWGPRSCPRCLGGRGPRCRLHLLQDGGAGPPRDRLRDELSDLHRRVARFNRSLVWKGPAATAEEKASWVEGLGWLYGWSYPARMLPAPRP